MRAWVFGLLAQHLGFYAQLGVAAAAEYRKGWVRRLLLFSIAVLAGLGGIAAAWIAGLAALWDTPWRVPYVVASAIALLTGAAVALYAALAARPAGTAAGLLRAELQKDRELVMQWTRTL
jgi:hypothetical protein